MRLPLLFWMAPSGQGGGSMGIFLVQMAAIMAIFYFLLIRPQRQKQKRHEKRLTELKRGDEVVTAGGIIGQIVHIKDNQVTVKSGETKVIIERQRIAEVLDEGEEPAKKS